MKDNLLLKMNSSLGLVMVLGFVLVATLNYQYNIRHFMADIENVAGLTSEGIFYRLEYFFAKPVNVSLTMAQDGLLQS